MGKPPKNTYYFKRAKNGYALQKDLFFKEPKMGKPPKKAYYFKRAKNG